MEAEEVEEVTKLKYLRVTISRDGECNDEIEQRIGAAVRVVGAMRKECWREENCRRQLK